MLGNQLRGEIHLALLCMKLHSSFFQPSSRHMVRTCDQNCVDSNRVTEYPAPLSTGLLLYLWAVSCYKNLVGQLCEPTKTVASVWYPGQLFVIVSSTTLTTLQRTPRNGYMIILCSLCATVRNIVAQRSLQHAHPRTVRKTASIKSSQGVFVQLGFVVLSLGLCFNVETHTPTTSVLAFLSPCDKSTNLVLCLACPIRRRLRPRRAGANYISQVEIFNVHLFVCLRCICVYLEQALVLFSRPLCRDCPIAGRRLPNQRP